MRDIAREARVADGALYNYFEDKEDLLAHALLAHVATVMSEAPRMMPEAGTGTVAENLTVFIGRGMESLYRVAPAFAGLMSQPNVLRRFHAMVGGDPAFAAPAGGQDPGGELAPGPRPRRPRRSRSLTSPAASPRSCSTTCRPNSGWAGSHRRRPRRGHLADRGRDPRPGAAPGPVRPARPPARHPARPGGPAGHDRPARPGAQDVLTAGYPGHVTRPPAPGPAPLGPAARACRNRRAQPAGLVQIPLAQIPQAGGHGLGRRLAVAHGGDARPARSR